MLGRLINKLGFLGTSAAYRQISQGNYIPPPEVDYHLKELLKELKQNEGLINKLEAIITTNIFQKGWKIMREKKLTRITGIYFRYMKVYALSPTLVDFEATMSHILLYTSYAPNE